MTKEVMINITGIQNEFERESPVQQIVPGEYYYRNGHHFLVYEEVMDDEEGLGTNKCLMKISQDQVEITKRGIGNVKMIFRKDEKTLASYPSPFGNILTGFHTFRISLFEVRNCLELDIEYELEMNGTYMSDCEIRVEVEPRVEEQQD